MASLPPLTLPYSSVITVTPLRSVHSLALSYLFGKTKTWLTQLCLLHAYSHAAEQNEQLY